ncbi:unnamed protein product [Oppiella nova]|uniref:MAM domain-containing protein n=1 Tax=Oppiella nova TaxID=334625 RepID=A0A7R9M9G5_9ACAR|nr:unnamed protein product [Oppiella nova]CAG2173284.1 unnamed protein product [Oppiella nova]
MIANLPEVRPDPSTDGNTPPIGMKALLVYISSLILGVYNSENLIPITRYDCNFDSGDLCQWTDISAGDYEWVVRKPMGGVLPSVDGSGRTSGKFAIIDTHMKDSNIAAVLTTSPLVATKPNCVLNLRYRSYVPTSYIATFKVIVQSPDNGGRDVLVEHELHKEWTTLTANIGQLAEGSRVQLSGYGVTYQNDPPYADVDIDDIKFNTILGLQVH